MARILNLFFGVPQSKYAGVAILVSLAAVGLAILFSKERVPVSQKLIVVGLLFLLSLPAMLVTLFQLTCMVTGAGFKNQRWWCSGYAWLVSALIILYSILLVVMTVLSFVSEKQSKEVEKFYSRRENFEEMAKAALTEEEKKMLQTGGAPEVTSEMPAVPTMPVEMPSVNMLPMTPEGGLAQEEVPLDISMPPSTVSAVGPETFTSCGAPYQ